jgi:transcriptional regulator with XRE-family HTH domain
VDRDQPSAELAEAIDSAITASKKKVRELARALHVDERTLLRYRRGLRTPPRDWVEDLEKACGAQAGTLLTIYDARPRLAGTDEPRPADEDGRTGGSILTEEAPSPAADGRQREEHIRFAAEKKIGRDASQPMDGTRAIGTAPVSGAPESARPGAARRRPILGVLGLVAVAAVVVAAVLISHNGTHAQSRNAARSPQGSGPASNSATTRSRPVAPKGVRPVVEFADNHLGSPVFAAPDGSHVVGALPRIPYGTKLRVTCEVPNTSSSLPSVTAFYLVAGGRWDSDYVVADTMSNGGPLGNTDTPNVDPRVRACEH